MAKCPKCGTEIELPKDVVENEILECPTCGIELEIVSLDPLKVDLAPEEEEDWGERDGTGKVRLGILFSSLS